MGVAVVGFLGVIAGAVVTGGVQSLLALFSRRLGARTAARLLYATLLEAAAVTRVAMTERDFGTGTDDWSKFTAQWDQQRSLLARALKTEDFIDVSNAFMGLGRATALRSLYLSPEADGTIDSSFDEDVEQILQTYHSAVVAAEEIVWRASFPRWRRRSLGPSPLSEAHGLAAALPKRPKGSGLSGGNV